MLIFSCVAMAFFALTFGLVHVCIRLGAVS